MVRQVNQTSQEAFFSVSSPNFADLANQLSKFASGTPGSDREYGILNDEEIRFEVKNFSFPLFLKVCLICFEVANCNSESRPKCTPSEARRHKQPIVGCFEFLRISEGGAVPIIVSDL